MCSGIIIAKKKKKIKIIKNHQAKKNKKIF